MQNSLGRCDYFGSRRARLPLFLAGEGTTIKMNQSNSSSDTERASTNFLMSPYQLMTPLQRQEADQVKDTMKQRCEILRQEVDTSRVLCEQLLNYLSENMDHMDLATSTELLHQQQNSLSRYLDAIDEWMANVDAKHQYSLSLHIPSSLVKATETSSSTRR